MLDFTRKTTRRLSQPDVFFYCGLWLLVLLFCGTVAQRDIGLYQAQLKYFSSFFFWFYGLPLPAGWTVMGIILTSLSLKTLFYTEDIKKNLGSFITHTGIILLITGGFITTLFSQEGYMTIAEGEQSQIISDYHNVELAITDKTSGEMESFSQKLLKKQNILKAKKGGFKIRIKDFIRNTEPVQRETLKSYPFKGFARVFELKRKPLEKMNEDNIAGLIFQILNNGKEEVYSVFEGMPIKQTIKQKDKTYIAELRPLRTYLPFFIHLIDFEKDYYPGTDKPRSYKSLIEIKDNFGTQKRVIKMNQPLRHKSWTFYQSSFIEEEESEATVLAVIKNSGRAFPYLSSLIICFGLLIHIILNISFFKRKS